jgi:hypothetical protein
VVNFFKASAIWIRILDAWILNNQEFAEHRKKKVVLDDAHLSTAP